MTTTVGRERPGDGTASAVHLHLSGGPRRRRVPLRVDALEVDELFGLLDEAVETRRQLFLMSANLHWVALSARDPGLQALAERIHLSLLDSTPLRWLLEAQLGRPVAKLAGSDLVPELCRWSAASGARLFFLGAAPGSVDAAAAEARRRYPGCQVAGTLAPSPAEIDDPSASRELCARIDATAPDVLLVALGMPRQERWILRHAGDLEVPIRFGIGASLDFLAGAVPRAPVALQDAGLEWAWRMAREPRRLWRRYLVEDLPFGLDIAAQLARRPRPAVPPVATPVPRPIGTVAAPAERHGTSHAA